MITDPRDTAAKYRYSRQSLEDAVRYERKNVQQCKPFTPTCMVILASNEPVQSSDYTRSGGG